MNTTLKYVLIGVATLGVGYIVYRVWKSRNMNDKPSKTTPKMTGYTRKETANTIITIPNDEITRKNVVYVWGGISGYAGTWMEKQIPESLKDKYTFVLTKAHNNPYSTVMNEAKSALGFTPIYKAIAGFSGGGTIVQDNFDTGNFDAVFLIDPSTNTRFVTKDWSKPKKVVMAYYRPNWGSKYQSIKDAQPKVAEAIKKAGGVAVEKQIKHLEYPKAFMVEHL